MVVNAVGRCTLSLRERAQLGFRAPSTVSMTSSEWQGDRWVRLSSTANAEVKRAVKLREQARFRRDQETALVVGGAPIAELGCRGGAAEVRIATVIFLFH